MALLITAAIAISYFDRQTLPVAIRAIQREFPVSNTQFSQLQAAFLAAYALMYAVSGKLIDVLGTRKGFLLIMLWWSLACASQGLATSVGVLAGSLFLLGMGEGGGFPAATKAMAEWFPASERSTAMGLMNAGTAVGAVAAPPLIAITLAHLNWRWVFFLAGAVGLAWTLWWITEYHPPASHPRLSAEERLEIAEVLDKKAESTRAIRWIDLLKYPQVAGLVTAKFLSDAAWYFYIFWLPKYLYDVHHFDTKQVGYFAWIPYAAAGIGSLLGGWFSSRLIKGGHSVNFSRKAALGISAGVMPLILLVSHSPVQLVIVLFSIAFAFGCTSNDCHWLSMDFVGEVQCSQNLRHAVAVNFNNMPVERRPLVYDGLGWHYLVRRASLLHSVVVHNNRQVTKSVLGAHQQAFPDHAAV